MLTFEMIPLRSLMATRKYLLFIILYTLIFQFAKAQTTIIYIQDFGTGTSFPAGWSASGAQSTNLTVNTSSASNGYTLPSGTSASAGSNVTDGYPGSTIGTAVLTVTGVISTVGYSGIKVTYGARETNSYTGTILFEWSSNGITWNNITPGNVANNSTWRAINSGVSIILPPTANGQPNLRFRWTFTRTNTNGNYRIDDFVVYTGTLLLATFTELVVPKYIAGSPVSGTNTGRTPIAVCFQIDNLSASTTYDLRYGFALTLDGNSISNLSGLMWNGSLFTASGFGNYTSAFTSNAAGSSGPFWAFLQPSGNARFNPGNNLKIRFAYRVSGGSFSSTINFETPDSLTTLDAGANTTYSAATTDDGAYLKIASSSLLSGKYILGYNNSTGTGNPLFSYQCRATTANQSSQSELPTLINDIYQTSGGAGTANPGDAPMVIPIGANNNAGVKRIEVRNADNSIFAYFTKTNGIWDDGALTQNTTTIPRANVQTISLLKGTFDDVGIFANLAQTGDMTVSDTLDIFSNAGLNINNNTLTLNGTITNSSRLDGSNNSNLTVGGASTNTLGILNFSTGNQTLNNLTINRTGLSQKAAALLGTNLTIKSLTLTNGILGINHKLLTYTNTGGIYTPPASPADSYICTCDSLAVTDAITGTQGFQINNVGGTNTDIFFPVSSDYKSPNRMMINNLNGSANDFTVVVGKGDIGNTANARVNRIWYVNATSTGTGNNATMRLYFTKRNWSISPFPLSQDEVETGFDYTDIHLVQENNSNVFLNISNGSDKQDFSNIMTYPYGSEIFGLYSYGVSPDYLGATQGINTFIKFSVINATGYILPVNIIGFKAWQQGTAVQLAWTALNEIDIDHYEVERSADARGFIILGNVAAKNTGSSADYSFADYKPNAGNNYYRIKVLDKNGAIYYTQIINVVININGGASIAMYPNPVINKRFTLQMINLPAAKYNLLIYDEKGRLVFSKTIEHTGGSASQAIELTTGVAAGVYEVRLISKDYNFEEKLVITVN